jgi:hypothetical protein
LIRDVLAARRSALTSDKNSRFSGKADKFSARTLFFLYLFNMKLAAKELARPQ